MHRNHSSANTEQIHHKNATIEPKENLSFRQYDYFVGIRVKPIFHNKIPNATYIPPAHIGVKLGLFALVLGLLALVLG